MFFLNESIAIVAKEKIVKCKNVKIKSLAKLAGNKEKVTESYLSKHLTINTLLRFICYLLKT